MVQKPNSYVRFNYLENRFDTWLLKAQEYQRQSGYYSCGWKGIVKKYCIDNGIRFIDETIQEREERNRRIIEFLDEYVDRKLFTEDKSFFREKMRELMKHKRGNPRAETMSNFLKENGIPYLVENGERQNLGERTDTPIIVKRKE